MKIFALFGVLLVFMLGCAPNVAPVINKSPYRKIPNTYKVQPGDSIYTIAWGYGVDFLDVAKWSGLKEPYRLQPAQVIVLRGGSANPALVNNANSQASSRVKKVPANQSSVAVAVTTKPKQKTAKIIRKPIAGKMPARWYWPAKGTVVGKFSPSKGVNGIQIAGQTGSDVKAAASGEVVYVGEGLRGYGKLIIVKHSKRFLSAYAHNKDILVREGQVIKARQQIARMGSSGAKSTMLHFEIRKNGNPVNPLGYLK